MLHSTRTTVRRKPDRAAYDASTVERILDEGFICHVGFVVDGQPFVIPTAYARRDKTLYLHGSPMSRMLGMLKDSIDVCVTVTLVDGLVLARSAFHHSINYRSVVVLGKAYEVVERIEKEVALRRVVEHIVPGRSGDARMPNAKELRATLLLGLPIEEASAKSRTGPPQDPRSDCKLRIWAGELPLRLQPLPPISDPQLSPDIRPPDYVLHYTR